MRIAVSGSSGCGNTTVTGLVAEKLGLKKINYTLRDMAEEKGVAFKDFHGLADERFPELDYELDRKLVELAGQDNCVVGTRLAVWLDTQKVLDALGKAKKYSFDQKFWLDAPLEERARRIAGREGKPLEQALKETRERDQANESRYERAYGIKWGRPAEAMLVDTTALNAGQVAERIVSEVKCITRN